ncbi:MAG: ribosome maturation factor RimM [Paenibacillaceae bacterium]
MANEWFTVGTIANTHGLKGELKIVSRTDFPEERYRPGSRLTMMDPELTKQIEVEVVSSRNHKNTYIVKFKAWNDINEVEKFKGWLLKINKDQRIELPEHEFYYNEIVGCTVVSDEGDELGVIQEILSPGANDVWVVQPVTGKAVYIPYIEDVVKQVDVQNKKVIVHILEGLL